MKANFCSIAVRLPVALATLCLVAAGRNAFTGDGIALRGPKHQLDLGPTAPAGALARPFGSVSADLARSDRWAPRPAPTGGRTSEGTTLATVPLT